MKCKAKPSNTITQSIEISINKYKHVACFSFTANTAIAHMYFVPQANSLCSLDYARACAVIVLCFMFVVYDAEV